MESPLLLRQRRGASKFKTTACKSADEMPRIIVEDYWPLIWQASNISVVVDGREHAKLGRNIRADFVIGNGSHAIPARAGGAVSKPAHFQIAQREAISFTCLIEGILSKSLVLKKMSSQRHQDGFQRKSA
jgi:hypothetical protein